VADVENRLFRSVYVYPILAAVHGLLKLANAIATTVEFNLDKAMTDRRPQHFFPITQMRRDRRTGTA
jgi:hypothetical protein